MDVNEELNFSWKFKKRFYFIFFLGGGGRASGVGLGVRWDVNEELKFLGKFTKNLVVGGQVGVGLVGGGVRVDVNAMLGVGGDVGYGRCEPKIEGIYNCTMYKKVLYNIMKIKKKCRGRGNI